MDSNLNYKQHVTSIQERTQARLKTMRAITAIEGGANFRVLRLFYIQAIRSLVDYAAPLLATTGGDGASREAAKSCTSHHVGGPEVGEARQHESGG